MKDNYICQPYLAPTFLAGSIIIKEFNPKKIVYLDPKGKWRENPENLFHCTVNEILFQLWKLDEKQNKMLLDNIIKLFLR